MDTPAGRDAAAHAWKVGDNEWNYLGVADDLKTKGGGGGFSCVTFSPDGSVLAVGTQGRDVRLISVKDGKFNLLGNFPHEQRGERVSGVILCNDQTVISSSSGYVGGLAVRHFGFDGGKTLTDHVVSEDVRDGVKGITSLADGKKLVSIASNNTVRLWSTVALRTEREFAFMDQPRRVLLDSSPERVAIRFADRVALIDPVSGLTLLDLSPPKAQKIFAWAG